MFWDNKLMKLAFWISGGVIVTLIAIFTSYLFFKDIDHLREGSPERTVQQYLNNIMAHEFPQAYNTLDLPTRKDCPIEKFAMTSIDTAESLKGSTITLKSVDVFDDNAIVVVKISSIENPGFFSTYENIRSETLSLEFSDNSWAITGATFNQIC